jgi:hypothetical protein
MVSKGIRVTQVCQRGLALRFVYLCVKHRDRFGADEVRRREEGNDKGTI